MGYFAQIDKETNIVLQVINADTKEWCKMNLGGTWIETYKKTPNKKFAGIGYVYYPDVDNFISPSPEPSYILTDLKSEKSVLSEEEINKIALQKLREERNKKLFDTDYRIIADFPHPSEEVKQAWITYRQELRDLPTTSTPQLDENGKLTNVTWPTPPS